METRVFRIDELDAAPYNPRRQMTANEMADLKNNLRDNGYIESIVVNIHNGKKTIVSGHQRVRALKELGATEVECACVDLDDRDERELNVAMNRITSDWDTVKLANLFHEMQESQEPMLGMGFSLKEIQLIQSGSEDYKTHLFDDVRGIDDISLVVYPYKCPVCGHNAPRMSFVGH